MTEDTTISPLVHRHGGTGTTSAAFFDLDGTLIPGSANIPLAKAAFRAGMVTPKELLKDLRNGVSFILKGATDERSEQVRDRILAAVQGYPAAQVEALADTFMSTLVDSVGPTMRQVLDEHADHRRDRIVLSASPTEIVSRFAGEIGVEHGTGTTSERDAEGVYTGRLAGPFCYREGKVVVMRQLAAEYGYDLSESYAYSDSVSDLPMLAAVGHPVAVNPEPALRHLADQRGWPIIETSATPRARLTSFTGITRLARTVAAGTASGAAAMTVTALRSAVGGLRRTTRTGRRLATTGTALTAPGRLASEPNHG
jgi:HAD superfamily hydrolase (TIGR01490 family)